MRAVALLLAVLVLLAAGCGNSHRAALAKYINQVNAIENAMSVPLARAGRADRAFTTHTDLRTLQPQLAQAVVTMRTLGRRLSALQPPPEAKPVAGLLTQLVAQEASLVAEVHQTAVFLPAFDAGLTRVTPVSNAFKRSAHAATTIPEQEAALDAYVRGLGPPIAALQRLTPPPILRPTYTVQLSALMRSRTTAAALAAALRAKQTITAEALLAELGRIGVSSSSATAQRAQIAAVKAYDGRVDRVNALGARIQRELGRLESGLH